MVSHFLKHKRVEGRLKAKACGNPLISSVLQEHKAEVKSSIVSSNLNVEKVYWVDEGTEFLWVGCPNRAPGMTRVGGETKN